MRIYILLVVLLFNFAPARGIIHIKDGVGEGDARYFYCICSVTF